MLKEYTVVKIMSDTQIIIDGGLADNICHGDVFEIFDKGAEVKNPLTNESLGTLDFVKAAVEAVVVLPKMSICRNTETYTLIRDINSFSHVRNVPLKVNPEDISGGYENVDATIRIGNRARKRLTINNEN